jgi:phytoene dehydrogenase-like protein
LESGEIIEASEIVIATENQVAVKLTNNEIHTESWNSVSCLYYATDKSPISSPSLVLNGDREGIVNNLCVPSDVNPSYAPPGKSLISLSVLGTDLCEKLILAEMRDWFGPEVEKWSHLRTYKIPHAVIHQAPHHFSNPRKTTLVRPGVYCCGDHQESASIQGALLSGRKVAEEILASVPQMS